MSNDVITTNEPFREVWTLRGLEGQDRQFRISTSATVRIRVRSLDGKTGFMDWRTLTRNSDRDDDWGMSRVAFTLTGTETGGIDAVHAAIDIRVSGPYVDRDGSDLSETYDEKWSSIYKVEEGLA